MTLQKIVLQRPPRPVRRPLKTPLRPADEPLETDPRPPCMRCGNRPSEVIVGPGLGQGWLCYQCYARR
jgi:hypothetical protein